MKNVFVYSFSYEELGRVYERTKLSIKIEGLVTETDADALFRHVRSGKRARGRESSWETELELLT